MRYQNFFHKNITIDNRLIGPGSPCLIIAEAGVNHFGNIDKALQLVDLATQAGADVLKLQAL